jgi:hypothetical protein
MPTDARGSQSTMSRSLVEGYLKWLGSQIRNRRDAPDQQYQQLTQLMFEKEFVPLVGLDDNRVVDGVDLRSEFCFQKGLPTNSLENLGPGASFLEVLIGLSRRLAFSASGNAQSWAWQLLTNLELHKMPDPLTRRKQKQADDILDSCIWRTYRPDGQGGFFPLAWPQEDQTKVELWYQMAAYIDELHPEH